MATISRENAIKVVMETNGVTKQIAEKYTNSEIIEVLKLVGYGKDIHIVNEHLVSIMKEINQLHASIALYSMLIVSENDMAELRPLQEELNKTFNEIYKKYDFGNWKEN